MSRGRADLGTRELFSSRSLTSQRHETAKMVDKSWEESVRRLCLAEQTLERDTLRSQPMFVVNFSPAFSCFGTSTKATNRAGALVFRRKRSKIISLPASMHLHTSRARHSMSRLHITFLEKQEDGEASMTLIAGAMRGGRHAFCSREHRCAGTSDWMGPESLSWGADLFFCTGNLFLEKGTRATKRLRTRKRKLFTTVLGPLRCVKRNKARRDLLEGFCMVFLCCFLLFNGRRTYEQ